MASVVQSPCCPAIKLNLGIIKATLSNALHSSLWGRGTLKGIKLLIHSRLSNFPASLSNLGIFVAMADPLMGLSQTPQSL